MPTPPAGWRLVTPDAQPVAGALALPQRLLDDGDCPALVVHRVSPPAITCGRAQMGDVDMQAAHASGIEVLPRASGGGPVPKVRRFWQFVTSLESEFSGSANL